MKRKKREDALTSFTQKPERGFKKDREVEAQDDQGKGSSFSVGRKKRGKRGSWSVATHRCSYVLEHTSLDNITLGLFPPSSYIYMYNLYLTIILKQVFILLSYWYQLFDLITRSGNTYLITILHSCWLNLVSLSFSRLSLLSHPLSRVLLLELSLFPPVPEYK